MPFQNLIRAGNQQGLLLGDWPAWRRHRDMRSRVNHAYAAQVAEDGVNDIPDFLAKATHLCDAPIWMGRTG
jgi:hypothetical protein